MTVAVAVQNATRPLRRPKGEAQETPRQRLNLVVVERQRRRVSRSAVVLVALVGAMFAVVSLRIYMAQQQVNLDQLNQDVTKARQYFDQLRAERATLQSPTVLMEEARLLGMEPAVNVRIVAVSPDAAAAVAATVGKIDGEFLDDASTPLVQYGRVKSEVGRTP